jgi:1-acyl-sn-glycerol-3-phosphate acyltransferase
MRVSPGGANQAPDAVYCSRPGHRPDEKPLVISWERWGSVLGLETDFQRGAFALARHLGAPLLPVVLTGGHRVWEHPVGPALRNGQVVGVRVLPPASSSAVQAASPDAPRTRLQREMKREALLGGLPPPRRYVPEGDGFWDSHHFGIDPAFPERRARVETRRLLRGDTA